MNSILSIAYSKKNSANSYFISFGNERSDINLGCSWVRIKFWEQPLNLLLIYTDTTLQNSFIHYFPIE